MNLTRQTPLRQSDGGGDQCRLHVQTRLSAAHLQKLSRSALSPQQIESMGWLSLPNGRLEIPYLRPDGSAELCHDGKPFKRWRLSGTELDELKRQGHQKPGKYRSPKGEGCRLYHSALAIAAGNYPERLEDRFTPLRITEGELKAEAAAAHDPERLTIGLGGVSSWRDRYDDGQNSKPLTDWDEIQLEGREVRLAFDSDLQKPQVLAALKGLAQFLADRGAHVLVEVLPHGLDGARLGIDDLIYRHGTNAFLEVARIARHPFKSQRGSASWAFDPEPQDTRERNAYLFQMLGQHWRSSPNGKDHWQEWTGSFWQEVIGDDELNRRIERFATLQGWHNRELATLRSLQAAFRRSIKPAAETQPRGLLPFRNGCLVLADMHMIQHDPEHGNNWALPYDYDPAATCEDTQSFLLDRLGDPASTAMYRAFLRALLTGDRLKCFVELTGTSNTGKGVVANLAVALVGTSNTAAGKLHRIEDPTQRFETLKLKDRRLALFSECQGYSGPLEMLKSLTGGDPIPAEIKGGRHLDFIFRGGVMLVGNSPVRPSDQTGAVINRRRSLFVNKVVAACDERQLLDADGNGGWAGELAGELPGLVNWVLAMPAAEARAALARDNKSLVRAEAELEALLATDLLADWADQYLQWAPGCSLQVGTAESDASSRLFASYQRYVEQQGKNSRPLALRTFKPKLVDLLRDTLGLPFPAGNTSSGEYRERETGSVVPCLRWRITGTEEPGIIRHGFLARIKAGTDGNGSGTDAERQEPSRERMERMEWINPTHAYGGKQQPDPGAVFSPIAEGERFTVPTVPSVPYRGLPIHDPFRPVPETPFTVPETPPAAVGVPIDVQDKADRWEPGWIQLGTGKGSTTVLCQDPRGHSQQVERKRIRAGMLRREGGLAKGQVVEVLDGRGQAWQSGFEVLVPLTAEGLVKLRGQTGESFFKDPLNVRAAGAASGS